MGIMVYSYLWVMLDLYHQPWDGDRRVNPGRRRALGRVLLGDVETSNFSLLTPKPETIKG